MLLNKGIEQRPEAGNNERLNVLVLCTGNSARSIMAEAIFNSVGGKQFRAFSAGSRPTGKVNPFAIEQIATLGALPDYRSKSWLEYAKADAPAFDFVITVCDNAAGEACPTLFGKYIRIHWGLPDPAEYSDMPEQARQAFSTCFAALLSRIEALIAMPLNQMNKPEIAAAMRELAVDAEHQARDK